MPGRKDQIQALLTWVWNTRLIMDFSGCFPELLSMIWLLPGSPRFFFWCSVQETWVLFILLLNDSFMIGLTFWPMCRGGQGKSSRGIHYPFEIITLSNRKILLLSFLWVSLVGGHHYQIVFGSQRELFALS